jgi:uncharacterized damage-inducible protein DinB
MTSVTQSVAAILARDLLSLRREIESYEREEDLWTVPPGIANSAGTLALHLAGNLHHFVGAVLGGSAYVRDREAEFAARNLPRAELLARIEAARAACASAFATLDDARLDAEYPLPVATKRLQTRDFLIHLATHCTYHLGQIDYHRRFVTGTGTALNTVSPGHLASARPAE